MKHFWLTAALFLGFWAISVAQEDLPVQEAGIQNQYFTIHLGSFVKLDPQDFSDIRNLGYLYTESFNEHLTHLFLGEYATESKAEIILNKLHSKGFPDAYVSRRKLNKDQKVEVIQLGIELAGEKIAWEKYKDALPLSTIIEEKKLRIVAGPFPSHDATIQQVEHFKKVGYGNAFIRTDYSLRLHPVTDFEAPTLFLLPEHEPIVANTRATTKTTKPPIKLSVPQATDAEDVVVAKGGTPQEKIVVKKTAPTITVPEVQKIPDNYQPEFIAKAGITSGLALPNIRAKIKRTSALELQKVLKLNKYYEGSLDGFYGNGTSQAYYQFISDNKQWQRYSLLTTHLKNVDEQEEKNELVNSIGLIINTPTKAKLELEKATHPIAKAYRAYILLETGGELLEINNLMNAANRACFKDYKGESTFDFKATYSYQELPQLLDHLAILHSIKSEVPVPCWIFQKHQEQAIQSFSKVEGYVLEGCDPFMDWEVMQNLKTIATDLEHNFQIDAKREAQAAALRSKLFVNPVALNKKENTTILDWNKLFWERMNAWAAEDELHEKIITNLKVAFFQSQVLLEDHFINKEFSYIQAKGLALATLRTIVSE